MRMRGPRCDSISPGSWPSRAAFDGRGGSTSGEPVMERRAFMGALAGGLLAAPLAAEGQQAGKIYRIGILGNVPLTDPGSARLWGAFVQGLRELGYVDGGNTTIEYLSSDGKYE